MKSIDIDSLEIEGCTCNRVLADTQKCRHSRTFHDWRIVERRYNELVTVRDWYHEAELYELDALFKKAETSGAKKVWMLVDDGMRVIEYDGTFVRCQTIDDVVEKASKNPRDKGYVATAEEASTYIRARERSRTFSFRVYAFKKAFLSIVESRIRPFLERSQKCTSHNSYVIYEPTVVLINNEDRTYVATFDRCGMFKFDDFSSVLTFQ